MDIAVVSEIFKHTVSTKMNGVTMALVFTSVGIFKVTKVRHYCISSPTLISDFLYLDFLDTHRPASITTHLVIIRSFDFTDTTLI